MPFLSNEFNCPFSSQEHLCVSYDMLPLFAEVLTINNQIHFVIAKLREHSLQFYMQPACAHRASSEQIEHRISKQAMRRTRSNLSTQELNICLPQSFIELAPQFFF